MTTYATFPVFEETVYETLSIEILNAFVKQGADYGSQTKISNHSSEYRLGYVLRQNSKADRETLRAFFDARQGRAGEFWIRSHKTDYVTTSLAAVSASALVFNNYAAHVDMLAVGVAPLLRYRHIFVPDTGEFFKTSAPAAVGANIQVTVAPTVGVEIPAGTNVENVFLVRFDSDVLTISQTLIDPEVTQSTIVLQELQRESDT